MGGRWKWNSSNSPKGTLEPFGGTWPVLLALHQMAEHFCRDRRDVGVSIISGSHAAWACYQLLYLAD